MAALGRAVLSRPAACVHPGETHLGSTSDIDNAWYLGTCYYG
ncbi:DUF6355 family natural product biosynthesis protein [Streptomyces sp. NPDC047461]